jgi:hypothetical protein
MPGPKVLILDDDEMWLARHERRLREAGFECHCTQLASDAIDWAKTQLFSYALVDEILLVPPIPDDESKREMQRWQGSGVVREVVKARPNLHIILVTAAPILRSRGDAHIVTGETARLTRQPGVVDIIHKQDITADPDREYGWLIQSLWERFKGPTIIGFSQLIMPRVVIRLDIESKIFESLSEWLNDRADSEVARRRDELSYRSFWSGGLPLLGEGVSEIIPRAQHKSAYIELGGSKKRVQCKGIKPGSSEFRILLTLARRADEEGVPVIFEMDYEYDLRQRHSAAARSAGIDKVSFGEIASGREGTNPGIHIVGREGNRTPPLKVAISRLRKKLERLNVGPAALLFTGHQKGAYRAEFDATIVLHPRV